MSASTGDAVHDVDFSTIEARPAEPLQLYFGELWPGLENAVRVAAPLGKACLVCEEQIVAGDRGYLRAVFVDSETEAAAVHVECEALGIVGHTFGVCSCTGYDTTARASALELWRRLNDFKASTGQDDR